MGEWVTSTEFEAAEGTRDWRILAGGAVAWFEAPSFPAAAALLVAMADGGPGGPGIDVGVRAGGVRVRLLSVPEGLPATAVEAARRISGLAAEAGMRADPSVLRDVQVTIDAADAGAVMPFWAATLGYEQVGEEDLVDPLRRNPPI